MDTELKKLLRREASAHHMCEENRIALEQIISKGDAIALYKKTIDWALEEGYPSLTLLRRYFRDCEDEGIFIDKHFDGEVLDKSEVYVFHNCTGIIRTGLNVSMKIIPMLYFANGCNMLIRSSCPAITPIRVPLYVFGENRVRAERSEDMECKTYKFNVK